MDFGMMLLEKGNVAVSPGSGFGPAGEGFLRMSLVENEARLRQAVRQIQRCLREAEGQFTGETVVDRSATRISGDIMRGVALPGTKPCKNPSARFIAMGLLCPSCLAISPEETEVSVIVHAKPAGDAAT